MKVISEEQSMTPIHLVHSHSPQLKENFVIVSFTVNSC